MPSGFKSDRRLYITADKSRVVEAEDKSAAFLFAAPGREISEADAAAHGLECVDGKVILRNKAAPKAAPKAAKRPEDKALKKGADKATPRAAAAPRPPDRD